MALVADGARGIGKAIATRLALEGADVIIADIARTMLSRTAHEIAAKGCRLHTLTCDISKRKQVEWIVAKALQWLSLTELLFESPRYVA